jgi:hypothetical protein
MSVKLSRYKKNPIRFAKKKAKCSIYKKRITDFSKKRVLPAKASRRSPINNGDIGISGRNLGCQKSFNPLNTSKNTTKMQYFVKNTNCIKDKSD